MSDQHKLAETDLPVVEEEKIDALDHVKQESIAEGFEDVREGEDLEQKSVGYKVEYAEENSPDGYDPSQFQNRPDTRGETKTMGRFEEDDRATNQQPLLQQDGQYFHQNLNYSPSTRYKYVPLHKAPWNERFFLSSVLNNARAHTFYREFFDKPSKQKQRELIKPEKLKIPIEDFYRSTSMAQKLFNRSKKGSSGFRRNINIENEGRPQTMGSGRPTTQQSRPVMSQGGLRMSSRGGLASSQSQQNFLLNEVNWVDNFNVMASKNNLQVHKNYHEYFDAPIDYDIRGYTFSQKFQPMRVYESQTPIIASLKSTLRPASRAQTSQSPSRKTLLQNKEQTKPQTATIQSPGSQQRLGSSMGMRNPQLKTMRKSASQQSIKQPWNHRIGMGISQYNEKVFPRYKILFEHL